MGVPEEPSETMVERTAEQLAKVERHHLIEGRKDAGPVGCKVTPQSKKDLTRYVRWPRYIRIQRQKAVLLKRMKVPPAIAQFQSTLSKNHTKNVIKLLEAHKPESQLERRKRHRDEAQAVAKKQTVTSQKKATTVATGIQTVTRAIETGRAKMVVIAHDVDPIEIVLFLPALCRKFEVPYCFLKSIARLGESVGLKKTTCVAFTEVLAQHKPVFEEMRTVFLAQYNNNVALRLTWGGNIMSKKFLDKQAEMARRAAQ